MVQSKERNLDKVISKLYKKVLSRQAKDDVSFRIFPPRFSEIKGMFRSYIHLNAVDKNNSLFTKLFRENISAKDMNMFVSNFVITILLEVQQMGLVTLDKKSILDCLEALTLFRDKNFDNIPLYTFWKQIKLDKYWSQSPDTMVKLLENQPNWDLFISIAKKLGLKKIENFFETFKTLWSSFTYAYRIPADLDDTFTALAMTSLLSNLQDQEYNKAWVDKNTRVKELFEVILKFAYKPFTSNSDINPIDPRTYFWIHGFLNKTRTEEPNRELILPTTWLWDWKELNASFPNVSIPFSCNNIDLNVAGNFLFGVTNMIINYRNQTYVNEIFSDEMIQMIGDTADLFVYVIENDLIIKRPDITILYYPSIYDFYWLASRVYSSIKNSSIKRDVTYGDKLREKLLEVGNKLDKALRMQSTDLINSKLHSNKDTKEKYLVEFLGNYANKDRNEDALFATSLGLNTLINIWTYTKDGLLFYDGNTPDEVKGNIDSMAYYIINRHDRFLESHEGAFFSGSVHNSYSSMPFYYPADFFRNINGTVYKPNDPTIFKSSGMSIGIEKYMTDEEFQNQTKEKHYGEDTPLEANEMNSSVFPFWSSPAITESLALLAISKYSKIE